MSCGNPHDTDCSEVLDSVYFYLDGEMTSEVRHQIAVHLDECAPCLRQYGLEHAVKALVHRSCGGERAPEALRLSVLTRLQSLRVDVGTGDGD